MANIEISGEILERIGAEAARRHVTLAEVVTDPAEGVPPTRSENRRGAPTFVAAGESGAGIRNRIDGVLAGGFGSS